MDIQHSPLLETASTKKGSGFSLEITMFAAHLGVAYTETFPLLGVIGSALSVVISTAQIVAGVAFSVLSLIAYTISGYNSNYFLKKTLVSFLHVQMGVFHLLPSIANIITLGYTGKRTYEVAERTNESVRKFIGQVSKLKAEATPIFLQLKKILNMSLSDIGNALDKKKDGKAVDSKPAIEGANTPAPPVAVEVTPVTPSGPVPV